MASNNWSYPLQTQLIDKQKRRTMAIMAGSAAAIALPSLATAAQITPDKISGEIAIDSSNPNVEIILSLENSPTVIIRNNTEHVVIIKHVYPGVVHTNGRTFDINSLFVGSATGLGAKQTRRLPIVEASSASTEREFPKGLIGSKPVRIARVDNDAESNKVILAHRNYFFSKKQGYA